MRFDPVQRCCRHGGSTAKPFLLGVVAALLLLVGVGLVVIYTGAYNVAADKPHSAVETWILGTAMMNSVKLRATEITPPTDLDSQRRVELDL